MQTGAADETSMKCLRVEELIYGNLFAEKCILHEHCISFFSVRLHKKVFNVFTRGLNSSPGHLRYSIKLGTASSYSTENQYSRKKSINIYVCTHYTAVEFILQPEASLTSNNLYE